MNFIDEFTNIVFIEDEPQPADILFVPGGAYAAPARKAAELYKYGFAPLILPSGRFPKLTGAFPGPLDYTADRHYETEWAFLHEVLLKEGVNDQAILKEDQATYTYENAIYSRQVTDNLGLKIDKAILCCQAFHAQRSLLYYMILYPETIFYVCPAVTQGITRDNWHLDAHKTDIVLGEIKRLGTQFHDIIRKHADGAR